MKYLCLVYYEEKKLDTLSESDERRPPGRGPRLPRGAPDRAVTTSPRTVSSPCERPRPCASGTARCPPPTARSPRRRSSWAGSMLIEARDLNDAIRVASRIPPARLGCVEVRPVRESTPPAPERPAAGDRRRGRAGARGGRGGLPLRLAPRPRHPHPPPRRLRPGRGGAARGLRGRRRAVAAGRHARQSARVARLGRPLQGHRQPAPARPVRRVAGRPRRAARRRRAGRRDAGERRRRGRPPAADLHLLPSRLAAGRPGGADAARGLRPHDRGDRARLPQRADDASPSASCAPRRRSGTRASPIRCRRAPTCRTGSTPCST